MSAAADSLFGLRGKVALITGANTGLGLGYGEAIAAHGGDVVIWGRREDKNAEAARTLERHGQRVLAQTVDVSDEQRVIDAMAEAVATMGRLDCVIANAGISGSRGPFAEMTTEDYHAVLAVGQHGAFYTLREAVRHMVTRAEAGDPGGSLIVTGSLTMIMGRPYREHYAAAKGAVLAMTRGIAVEYARYGIRANVVAPGRIETELGNSTPSIESREQMTAEVPMRRFGSTAELGGIIVYLMSDASSYHTGDLIVVDGGLSCA